MALAVLQNTVRGSGSTDGQLGVESFPWQCHSFEACRKWSQDLPAHAYKLDMQSARGHWNTQCELQTVQFSHRAILSVRRSAKYLEVQRVLQLYWYFVARGFRPAAHQLIKLAYKYEHGAIGEYQSYRTLSVQLVTTIRALSLGRN